MFRTNLRGTTTIRFQITDIPNYLIEKLGDESVQYVSALKTRLYQVAFVAKEYLSGATGYLT